MTDVRRDFPAASAARITGFLISKAIFGSQSKAVKIWPKMLEKKASGRGPPLADSIFFTSATQSGYRSGRHLALRHADVECWQPFHSIRPASERRQKFMHLGWLAGAA